MVRSSFNTVADSGVNFEKYWVAFSPSYRMVSLRSGYRVIELTIEQISMSTISEWLM